MSFFRQIKKHIVIIDDMRYNLITVFYLGEAGVMRNIFGLFTKKTYIMKSLRLIIIACVLVYVLSMSMLLPLISSTYFEADAQEDILSSELTNNTDNQSVEEILSEPSFSDDAEESELYIDEYTNQWDNNADIEPEVSHEEVSLRTANEKQFKMSDGSYMLMSYPNDIHYLENGEYKEIDNSLKKQGNVYKNNKNAMQVELPVTYSKNSKTKISFGDYKLEFKLDKFVTDQENDLTIENQEYEYKVKSANGYKFDLNIKSKAKYKFNNSQVELEHVLIGTKLKENIIIHTALPSYIFKFDIKTKGLYLELTENGVVNAISKSTGELVFIIPKGYMFDSVGNFSDNVNYELKEKASGYTLEVIPDEAWIKNTDRVFPITIDPSVNINTSDFKSAATGTITNGLMSVNTESFGFIDFTLPEILNKATVLSASLYLSIQASSDSIVNFWENTSEFSDNNVPSDASLEIPEDINDENSPKTKVYINYYYDPNNEIPPYGIFKASKSSSLQRYTLDITTKIKNIVDFYTLDDFHGFAINLQAGNGISIANEDYTGSSHMPVLEIQYRNMVGIESYWDYDQYEVGNNSVYVNNYNDEATVVHTDAVINSEMPIELQHVYMDRYSSINYNVDEIFTGMNFGYGWKLNYQQIIRCRGANFEYYDADGTMHFFKYESAKGYSVDEDGLGLKLYNFTNNAFRMVDNSDNNKYFDNHGRMFKIVDRNGNVINILYGNGNQHTTAGLPITEINDNCGNSITFNYDTNGYLTSLNYKRADGVTEGSTSFVYSDNKIIKIVNDDGTFTEYGYNGDKLQSLSTESAYKLELISDATGVFSTSIDMIYAWLEPPNAKVRSIWRSVEGQERVHIKDNVYCHGLTLCVTAKGGEDYVPYSSFQVFKDMNEEDMEPLYSGMSDFEKALFILTIGWAYMIYYGYNNIEPYMDTCEEYYVSNYRIKKNFDMAGRLISSYTDEYSSQSVDVRYEQTNIDSVNVNNNKINASSTNVSNIANYVRNPSFEFGSSLWNLPDNNGVGGSASVSDKYSSHGNASMELFTAQGNAFSVSQLIYALPGTYTVTGYIKVDNVLIPSEGQNNYGAFISVYRTNGVLLGRSEYVYEDIYINNNGFKKVVFSFSLGSPSLQNTNFIYIRLEMYGCSGFAYFDQVQMAYSNYGYVSDYNNALNPAFFYGDSSTNTGIEHWNIWDDIPDANFSVIDYELSQEAANGISQVALHNNGTGSVNLYQTVALEENNQSVAYNLSVWLSKVEQYYLYEEDAYIGLNYRLFDKDMNPLTGFVLETADLSFSLWYKVAQTFIAPPEAKYVEINIQLNKIIGTIYVDNASLIKAQVVNLEYDDYGNCSYYSDGYNSYELEEGDVNSVIGVNGVANYGVVKDDNGNVILSNDFARQVKTEYSYDSVGRITEETFATLNDSKRISSSTDYSTISENLLDVVTKVDSLGFETIENAYSYSGLLLKTEFNDGTYVEYDYGAASGSFVALPASIIIRNKDENGNTLSTVKYNYMTSADPLTSLSEYGHRHVGMLESVEMANGTVYSYVYDKWGNISEVKINGNTQIAYAYNLTGQVVSETWANGYKENYYYDSRYRLSEMIATDSSNTVVKHYYYEYTINDDLVGQYDALTNKCYISQIDANNRNTLYAQGHYTVIGYSKVPSYDYIMETVYGYYGEVVRTNEIEVIGPSFGITVNSQNLSGTLTRNRVGLTETVKIGNATKIVYTYNSANAEYGRIIQEDNALLKNNNYPNGIRIKYERDNAGRIIALIVSPYGSDNNAAVISAGHKFNNVINDYDGGYKSLWDLEWMQDNAPCFESTPATALPDEESNGTVIGNIIKVHPATFYKDDTFYSMVDPTLLKAGILGSEITFWAKVLSVTSTSDANIMVPRIRYTDNTVSSAWDKVNNVACNKVINNGNWQFFSIPINKNKTIASLELPWYNGAWIAIGGMSLYGKKDAWNTDWALAHVANTNYPATKMPAQKPGATNVVTDIIRVHPSTFYQGNFGGTEVYQSLVNPELLINGGDEIVVSYQARIHELNPNYSSRSDKDSLIRGLRFRYSDGTADYAGHMSIAYNTDWQSITIVSATGKQVIGIELGYNYGDWILLGDIMVSVKNMGRLDDRIIAQSMSDNSYIAYEYDELGRLDNLNLYSDKTDDSALISESFTYLDGTGGNTTFNMTSKTINYGTNGYLIYSHTYNLDNAALGSVQTERSNPYNIYQIKEGNTVKAEYSYDKLGRLVRENNVYLNKTVTYTYDANNNIVSKTVYPYTSSADLTGGTVISYSYGDSAFKDRLTSYNGQSITYDGSGNPVTYMGNSLTWQGRELIAFGSVTFDYDMNGMRTAKGNTAYTYIGSTLYRETNGANVIEYLYNQNGLVGFTLNGTSYYYISNMLGDVTGIIDDTGNLVVQYTYDSWGKVLTVGGALASTVGAANPIRYRGYYYDTETGLYYLVSRYYDPETGRFISPDQFEYIGTGSETLSYNLYTYCENDPVKYSDSTGNVAISSYLTGLGISTLIGALVGAVSYTVTQTIEYAVSGDFDWSWGEFIGATVSGATTGAIAYVAPNCLMSVVVSGVVGGLSTAGGMMLGNLFNETDYSEKEIKDASMKSAFLSAISVRTLPNIKIAGLTAGRNSISAISKQIVTKFKRGVIKRITVTTFCKMFSYELYNNSLTTILEGII